MQKSRNLFKALFWLVTSSLIAFCLLFGLPFVSTIAAGKLVAIAGCTPPSFDMQAVCPVGSFAEPFVPLSHWFTSGMAPLVLAQNFGVMLTAWASLCVALGLICRALKAKGAP